MYNTIDDLSTGEVESTLVQTFNGAVDYFGSTRRTPKMQKIVFKGTYISQRGVIGILDKDTQFHPLVDDYDNKYVNTEQFFSDLKVRTDLLKGKLGFLDRLIRQPEDAVGKTGIAKALQWKLSRLLSVKHERSLKDTNRAAHIEATFETIMYAWKSDTVTYFPEGGTPGVTSGLSATPEMTVGGTESVNDFMLRIRPRSDLTKFTVSVNGSTITWDINGKPETPTRPAIPAASSPIKAGSTVEIDMGRETIKVDGRETIVDKGADLVYTYFDMAPVAPGWLYLKPGLNKMTVTSTGSEINFWIEYYTQWT
ncbi:MAG: hypothetical protein KDE31_12135 [Caldilineaceae bacterium]|nr:hypothetical protein [Caldilineaceae bacterium]